MYIYVNIHSYSYRRIYTYMHVHTHRDGTSLPSCCHARRMVYVELVPPPLGELGVSLPCNARQLSELVLVARVTVKSHSVLRIRHSFRFVYMCRCWVPTPSMSSAIKKAVRSKSCNPMSNNVATPEQILLFRASKSRQLRKTI